MPRIPTDTQGKPPAKRKTSITLPIPAIALWKKYRRIFYANFPSLIHRCYKEKPRRDRMRKYNREAGTCIIVPVYWDNILYNELHAIASALRVSASYLIWCMLKSLLSGQRTEQNIFINYRFEIGRWSTSYLEYTETIGFSDQPP